MSTSDRVGFRADTGALRFQVNGRIASSTQNAVEIAGGSHGGQLTGYVESSARHGIEITDTNDCRIEADIFEPGFDSSSTWSGVRLVGTSDRNRIQGITFRPRPTGNPTAHAVLNIGTGECNKVVGCDVGDDSLYTAGAFSGALLIDFPADITLGDNWRESCSS
jgi:hypothetical protein